MVKSKLARCPICDYKKATGLLNLNCGGSDNSILYPTVRIRACEKCGHIYNKLSSDEIIGLGRYYNEEYAPTNMSSTNKTGDMPGSNNRNTTGRYAQLYSLISPYVNDRNFKVLDIGCAMGGFLDYLHKKGLNDLYGIDISEKYINYSKQKSVYNVRMGNIERIPFGAGAMNLVVADQVLEHLVNPRKAFQEARRILASDGLFCIGVPDASRYGKKYFFDFFWFLVREHIQHFDIEHLKLLAGQEGFDLIGFDKGETPMMSEKMILPTLNVVFRLTRSRCGPEITEDCFRLKKEIEHDLANDFKKLKKRSKMITGLSASKKPIYAWGIGKEFLYLYESAGLKKCNIAGLIDLNPYKQKTFSIDGKKIMSRSILKKATADSVLIISAVAHTTPIKRELLKMGYSGKIVEV